MNPNQQHYHYQPPPPPPPMFAADGSHMITSVQTLARSSKLTKQLDRKPQNSLLGYYDPKSVAVRSKTARAGILPAHHRSNKYLEANSSMQVYAMLHQQQSPQNNPQRPLYHLPYHLQFAAAAAQSQPTYEIPALLTTAPADTNYTTPVHQLSARPTPLPPSHYSRAATSTLGRPTQNAATTNRPLCRCRVMYLGSSVPHVTKNGLHGIQEPLRHLYPDEQFNRAAFASNINRKLKDQTTTDTQHANQKVTNSSNTIDISHLSSSLGIDSWLSVWSNGLLLENVDEFGREVKRFFSIESLHYCAAVRFFDTAALRRQTVADCSSQSMERCNQQQLGDEKPPQQQQDANNNSISASAHHQPSATLPQQPIIADQQQQQQQHPSPKSVVRFLPLDAPIFQCPGMLDPSHPPVFAAIMRRTTGVKVLECHAFICRRDAAANAMVRCCTHAYADFLNAKRLSAELGYPSLDLSLQVSRAPVSLLKEAGANSDRTSSLKTRSKSVGPATSNKRAGISREPPPERTVEALINVVSSGNGAVRDESLEDSNSIEDNYAIISRNHSTAGDPKNSVAPAPLPPPPPPLPLKVNMGTDSSSTQRSRRRRDQAKSSRTTKGSSTRSLFDDFMPKPLLANEDSDSDNNTVGMRQSCNSNHNNKNPRAKQNYYSEEKLSQSLDYLRFPSLAKGATTDKSDLRAAAVDDQSSATDNSHSSEVQYSVVKSKRHSKSMQNLESYYEFSATKARLSARRQNQRNLAHNRLKNTARSNHYPTGVSGGSSVAYGCNGNNNNQRRSASFHDIRDSIVSSASSSTNDLHNELRSSSSPLGTYPLQSRDSKAPSNGYNCTDHNNHRRHETAAIAATTTTKTQLSPGRAQTSTRIPSMGQFDSNNNENGSDENDDAIVVVGAHLREDQIDNGTNTNRSNRSAKKTDPSYKRRNCDDVASSFSRTGRAIQSRLHATAGATSTTKLLNGAEQQSMDASSALWAPPVHFQSGQQHPSHHYQAPNTYYYSHQPAANAAIMAQTHPLNPLYSNTRQPQPMFLPYYVPQSQQVGHYMAAAATAGNQSHHYHHNHLHHPQPVYAAPSNIYDSATAAAHMAYAQYPYRLSGIVPVPAPSKNGSKDRDAAAGSTTTKSSLATRFRCLSPPVNFFGHLNKKANTGPINAAGHQPLNGGTTSGPTQAQVRSSSSTTTTAASSESSSSSASSESSPTSAVMRATDSSDANKDQPNDHCRTTHLTERTQRLAAQRAAPDGGDGGESVCQQTTGATDATTTTTANNVTAQPSLPIGSSSTSTLTSPSVKVSSKTTILSKQEPSQTNSNGNSKPLVVSSTLGRQKKMSLLKRLSLTISSGGHSDLTTETSNGNGKARNKGKTAASKASSCTDPSARGDHKSTSSAAITNGGSVTSTTTTTTTTAADNGHVGDGQQQQQKQARVGRKRAGLFSGSLTLGRGIGSKAAVAAAVAATEHPRLVT